MQGRIRNEACRTFAICVDFYERGMMSGWFCSLEQESEAETFCSLTQMIVSIEQKLNAANYPQSFTVMRSFAPIQEVRPDRREEARLSSGLVGTFVVKIFFRQHTSWQGTITWQEGCGEQAFRSVLELILLMDSALSSRWKRAEAERGSGAGDAAPGALEKR